MNQMGSTGTEKPAGTEGGLRRLLPKVEVFRSYHGFHVHVISDVLICTLEPNFDKQSVRELQTILVGVKMEQGKAVLDFGHVPELPPPVLESLDMVTRLARIGGAKLQLHTERPGLRKMLEQSRFNELKRFVDDY